MWSVQVTRLVDQAVGDQLAATRRWLTQEGIQPFDLRVVKRARCRCAAVLPAPASHSFASALRTLAGTWNYNGRAAVTHPLRAQT